MVVVHVPTVELGLGVDPTNKRSGSCGRGGGCRCGGRFNWCHEIVEDLAFGDSVVGHSKDHLHVMGGTASSNTPVKILWCGSGDEVVILARVELEATRSWCE